MSKTEHLHENYSITVTIRHDELREGAQLDPNFKVLKAANELGIKGYHLTRVEMHRVGIHPGGIHFIIIGKRPHARDCS